MRKGRSQKSEIVTSTRFKDYLVCIEIDRNEKRCWKNKEKGFESDNWHESSKKGARMMEGAVLCISCLACSETYTDRHYL